jgi:capsular polysaccharide biosynthesis protein
MSLKNLPVEAAKALRSGAARTAALLPGSSTQFGPPRHEATSDSITDTSALIRHSIVPARKSVRSIPELADPPLGDMMRRPRPAEIKEIFVAELPQGRYWGRYHGYIVDRTDTLLTDLSPTVMMPGKRHDGLDQLKLPPLREMSGTVAVINTLYASNFHHWLLDTLPRFEWLRRAGFDWNGIDYFILPGELLRFHRETLAMLGIDPSKVIGSDAQLHLRADKLLVPCHSEPSHFPGDFDYTPEGLHFVRELVLKDNPFPKNMYPKRIIVSREKAASRRLVQAEKANRLLADQGFVKVLLEDHSLHEQAAMFAQADCVVMPTGGNLANYVFCRPGTVAVELFSHNYVPPFTYAFMDTIGLRYYGVVTHAVSRPYPEARGNNEDIDVDPDRLAEIIRGALAKWKTSA